MKSSPTDSRRRRLLVRSLKSSPLDDPSPFDLDAPDDPFSLALHGESEDVDEPDENDTVVEVESVSSLPALTRLDAVLLALRPALSDPAENQVLRIPAKIDVLVKDAAVLRARIHQLAELLETSTEFPAESVQEAWDDCRRLAGFVYWELDRGLPLPESTTSGARVRKAR